MKVTNIIGSPHATGNTATIARTLVNELETSGAEVTTYELNKLNYRGCQGCWACQRTSYHCVLRDGLSQVLKDVETSDVVIIASPVYFGDVTSQTKGLIDRFFSYHASDFRTGTNPSRLAPSKRMVLVLPQSNPDQTAFDDIVAKYARIFGHLGFAEVHTIRAAGVGPEGDVLGHLGFGEVCSIRSAREGPESVVRTQEPLLKLIRETACRVISSFRVTKPHDGE